MEFEALSPDDFNGFEIFEFEKVTGLTLETMQSNIIKSLYGMVYISKRRAEVKETGKATTKWDDVLALPVKEVNAMYASDEDEDEVALPFEESPKD